MRNHAPYDALVGGAFSRLAPGIGLAHSSPLTAEGELRVEWSRSWFSRVIARAMRLPPEGDPIRTRLEVTAASDVLTWIRDFGSHRVKTRQWVKGQVLVESYGLGQSHFHLVPDGDALRYEPVGVWLGPFRVPSFLAPRIEARIQDAPGGWRVDVRIDHPRFGLLCRYDGIMRIRE